MLTVGQAPAVIPIPELSDEEKQERVDDLETVLQLHRGIREKIAKIQPQLNEIFKDFAKLEVHCTQIQTLRLARLKRRLMIEPLARFALGARYQLQQLSRVSERAERSAGDIEKDILDPSLYPSDRAAKRKPEKAKK